MKINQGKLRRVFVITADARTGHNPDWGKRKTPPGVFDVLGLVTTVPMSNYSSDTVDLVRRHEDFRRLELDLESYRACEQLAKKECPAFSMPLEPVRQALEALLARDPRPEEEVGVVA